MAQFVLPVLFALFLWWFSTGVIVYLDGLPRWTFRWTMLGATVLCVAGLYGLQASRDDTSIAGAYCSFTCGLAVWAWQEVSFLMGGVTGPRRERCREGCSGWPHFFHAVQTILYHELAIAASGIVVVALTWGAPNQVGVWLFVTLWIMRLSAKLNVFLGVPNLSEEFLPEHMAFLKGFLTRKPMNLFFPASVTGSTIVAVLLVQRAIAADASPFEQTAYTFTAAMLALATVEHWFMVLPLPATALWKWSLGSHEKPAQGTEDAASPSKNTHSIDAYVLDLAARNLADPVVGPVRNEAAFTA
jgi:putative photosynthetic complex assembly protein 2